MVVKEFNRSVLEQEISNNMLTAYSRAYNDRPKDKNFKMRIRIELESDVPLNKLSELKDVSAFNAIVSFTFASEAEHTMFLLKWA